MSGPSLTLIDAQPGVGDVIHYLPLAPSEQGGLLRAHINLYLHIRNDAAQTVHINQIILSVPGSSSDPAPFDVDLTIGAGLARWWRQPADYLAAVGSSPTLRLRFFAEGNATATSIVRTMVAHANPPSGGAYRFWAGPHDLRPDEFWRADGTAHPQDNPAQLFAHDVVVATYDPQSSTKYTDLLPGTDGSQNWHYCVWGKSIRAIGDGTVVDFRNDYPTNATPGQSDPLADAYWKGGPMIDGNGNFFTIASGGETVLYAHMQPGTLNPRLLAEDAVVHAGDFLGLAGNSGASSGPHLHIHACETGSGDHSWTGNPRPLLFKDVWEVSYLKHGGNTDTAPWVKVSKRGLAEGQCAVWPAATRPVKRALVSLRHFALSAEGQLWTTDSLQRILTTSARLPMRELYLDFDPGGAAQRLAVRGSKPYAIGSNNHIWEGKPDGWFMLAGSPKCKRLALDPGNGMPWVVREDDHIAHFNPVSKAWVEHPGQGRAKDICVANGTPYVIGSNDMIYKSLGAAGWQQLTGSQKATRIASDPSTGKIWLLDAAGAVLSGSGNGSWSAYDGPPGTQGASVSTEIAVLNGRPHVMGPDRGLWVGLATGGWWRVRLVGRAA